MYVLTFYIKTQTRRKDERFESMRGECERKHRYLSERSVDLRNVDQ